MAIYKNDKKVCQWEVGSYELVGNLFWTKEKELLTVSLQNIHIYRSCPSQYNKFEDIKLFIRKPLLSEMTVFGTNKNEFLGKAKTEDEVKHLILKTYYRGFYKRNRQ